MLSNSEGWAITQTCSLTSIGPWDVFLFHGEKGESPRPQAPCVLRLGTIWKNRKTEGRGGRGLSGDRVPWELRTHGWDSVLVPSSRRLSSGLLRSVSVCNKTFLPKLGSLESALGIWWGLWDSPFLPAEKAGLLWGGHSGTGRQLHPLGLERPLTFLCIYSNLGFLDRWHRKTWEELWSTPESTHNPGSPLTAVWQ